MTDSLEEGVRKAMGEPIRAESEPAGVEPVVEARQPVKRGQVGDPLMVVQDLEPHITLDQLTPTQLSLLFNAQNQMRAVMGEGEPSEDEGINLIRFVDQVRMLARAVELTLAGHIALDLEPGSKTAVRFCRLWVSPATREEEAPAPSSGLVAPDGAPIQRGGLGLVE